MNLSKVYESGFSELANVPRAPENCGLPLVMVDSCDADTRFLFTTMLNLWHYPVVTADLLKDLGASVTRRRATLLLLDSVYPFEENLTKMRRVREHNAHRHLPIILLSGFAQPHYRVLALNAGATDYLVKPLDFDLLQAMLKKHLAQAWQRPFLAE